MNESEILLQNGLYELDPSMELTDRQFHNLRIYYENLMEWNQNVNLTAITEEQDVYIKHFLDSLSIIKAKSRKVINENHLRMIDIGTGAGFPGLVLAIVFPNLQVTLADSLNKRILFLEDTVGKLGIKNVTCVHGRAEDLAHDAMYREQYDIAVSRAVADLSVLIEYCLPFVRTGGEFIAYKSEKAEEEIRLSGNAIPKVGGTVRKTIRFELPGTDYTRSFIIIKKTEATDAKYPRKAGMPSKKPLH